MSNVTTLTAYPEDTTGTAVSNKIVGEQQVVQSVDFTEYNFIVPKFAPYYLNGLSGTVRTVDGQVKNLVIGKDIVPSHRFIDASLAQATDIFGSLTFLNNALQGIVTLSYQTVGGVWTLDDAAWAQVMADKVHNPRTLSWDSVVFLPVSFPVKDHSNDTDDITNMGDIKESLAKVESAIAGQSNDDLGAHLNDQNNPHKVTAQQVGAYDRGQADAKIATATALAIAGHTGAADPHQQYLTAERAQTLIVAAIGAVRQPKNVTPAAAATNVSLTITLQGNGYFSLYGPLQNAAQFQVSRQQDFAANVVVDSGAIGAVQSFAVTAGLSSNAAYFWRCRYRDVEGTWSAWSAPTAFSTGSIIVQQPSITDPSNGSQNVTNAPLMKSSAFAVTGGSDTHASSDWEIWTGPAGSGTRVLQVLGSTGKTSYQVAAGILSPNITYYARVRYNATGAGTSAWSNDASFTTAGVVTKPSVTSPASGDVNILETPNIVSSAFAVTGGSDTHASSDWQIWTAANGTGTKVWESLASADKTTTKVPASLLAVNTTYYARVRHNGTALGPSAWSNDNQFTTAAAFFPTTPGQPYGGGFFVGKMTQINPDTGLAATYALIVAPKASGERSIAWCQEGRPAADVKAECISMSDGRANTMRGENSSSLAPGWARSLTIGGFSDWYIPSIHEVDMLFRVFKSDTSNNSNQVGTGSYDTTNPTAVPPYAAIASKSPLQTTIDAFKLNGTEEFSQPIGCSSWMYNDTTNGATNFLRAFKTTGSTWNTISGSTSYDQTFSPSTKRAVRRVLLPN